jgi:hypothetical protein
VVLAGSHLRDWPSACNLRLVHLGKPKSVTGLIATPKSFDRPISVRLDEFPAASTRERRLPSLVVGRQMYRAHSVPPFAGLLFVFIDFELGSGSVLLCALINLQVAERASATLSSKGGRKIDSQSCSLFVC